MVRAGNGPWTVGLDIGGTKTAAVLLDGDGVLQASSRRPTSGRPAALADCAALAVRELLTAAGLPLAAVAGVGLALPGIVDPEGGTVRNAVNLGIERPVPIGAQVRALLGDVDVRVENDLNAAVLGARHLLVAAGEPPEDDLAFLALGTGLAAGMLLDGRLRRGARSGTGEIGHLTLVPGGLPCKCGQLGCVERYGSGSALDAAWTVRTDRPVPVEVFEAAAAGEPLAVNVRDTFVHAVAAAIRVLVLTCDVATVVIGGGVSELGTPLYDALVAELRRQAADSPFLAAADMASRIRLAPAGVPVGAVGAALVARGLPASRERET